MGSELRTFIAQVDAVRRAIRSCRGVQLSSVAKRVKVQELVDTYFKTVRPSLAINDKHAETVRSVDASLQDLLAFSHTRGLISKFLSLLKEARAGLVELDSQRAGTGSHVAVAANTALDQRILTTLRALVPSAACAYEQAISDLLSDQRLSWRGPATDLREALRETLDHLAPDEDVEKGDGFKLEQDARRPTMKQKVRYILRKRGISKTLASTPESAADSVEIAVGSFVRSVYDRSSVSTHTATKKDEVLRVRDWVRVTLAELLEIRE